MNSKLILQALCVIGVLLNAFLLWRSISANLKTEEGKALWATQKKKAVYNAIVGFFANFFDTLGIGSYAPSSAAFKFGKSVDDLYVPGTLNVGDTMPVLLEAFLFFGIVEVEPLTLISMIIAAVVGAFVGAGFVTKWNKHAVQLAMGIGLAILGTIMLCRQLGVGPFGQVGTALGLHGAKLIIAVVINFVLGALMNIGVGLYAPCIALVSMMGMNVAAAFPIMMGSCAYLMAFGNGPKFIKENRYDMVAVLCQAIPGMVGVFLAAKFFSGLLGNPKTFAILLYVVVVVVFITAIMFLRDYAKSKKEAK